MTRLLAVALVATATWNSSGASWSDPIDHCDGPNPYSEYFDISIAGGGSSGCPAVRFTMHCQ